MSPLAEFARFTPRASRGTRLVLAASLWTAVGTGLLAAGMYWILGAPTARWLAAVPVALAAGWAKGRFVLGARADRNSRRILEGEPVLCIGGAFSWGSWAIALVMMATGAILRRSTIPRPWLGLLYAAIGAALLTASARAWRLWREFARA